MKSPESVTKMASRWPPLGLLEVVLRNSFLPEGLFIQQLMSSLLAFELVLHSPGPVAPGPLPLTTRPVTLMRAGESAMSGTGGSPLSVEENQSSRSEWEVSREVPN